MPAPRDNPSRGNAAQVGWDAALREIEHQAEHWETSDHGQVGYFIAQALRAAVEIARTGGLDCEHQHGSADVPESVVQLIERTPAVASLKSPSAALPPWSQPGA